MDSFHFFLWRIQKRRAGARTLSQCDKFSTMKTLNWQDSCSSKWRSLSGLNTNTSPVTSQGWALSYHLSHVVRHLLTSRDVSLRIGIHRFPWLFPNLPIPFRFKKKWEYGYCFQTSNGIGTSLPAYLNLFFLIWMKKSNKLKGLDSTATASIPAEKPPTKHFVYACRTR